MPFTLEDSEPIVVEGSEDSDAMDVDETQNATNTDNLSQYKLDEYDNDVQTDGAFVAFAEGRAITILRSYWTIQQH